MESVNHGSMWPVVAWAPPPRDLPCGAGAPLNKDSFGIDRKVTICSSLRLLLLRL
jgi:hypothetical protein